jgi:hypothetical protein
MVHEKDDFLHKDSSDINEGQQVEYNEEGVVEPEFTVDDDGIPYCKSQTDYKKIVAMNLKARYPNEFEKALTCTRCDHYKKDDCFFPKQEIDKIEQDRQSLKIRCSLCGMKIHRLYSILMSLYYKEKHNVHIPVMCCTCYAALENDTFGKSSKRRMILFGVSLSTSIYFLFTYALTVFIFNFIGVLLFILPFMFWGYISIRDMKNLYYLYKGRKYYNTILGAEEAPAEEESLREKLLDEDDKDTPKDGAFDSTGY